MTLDNRTDDTPEIQGMEDLEYVFRKAEKPLHSFRVGMEHEKFGLLNDTLEPIPYSGDRSIEAVFNLLIERLGFNPVKEKNGDIIALTKAGTAVSLEPGGQFELSGAILENNHQTCRELIEHRDITHSIGDELGIVWLGVGHTPFAERENITWVPKTRYDIMRNYLCRRGQRAWDMMLRTGTVQANFDWTDEEDMVLKMRAAVSVSSIVSAIYANSSIVGGKTTGWVSERQKIWLDVDPDRSGLPLFVFDPDFGYRKYIEWALDVPMFFIRRDGNYLRSVTGMPFRHFLEKGAEGERARFSDWEDHLTTLFPEARIKSCLEVRGADCCSRDLNCALPALWKGILYSREAMNAAYSLTKNWSPQIRIEALEKTARYGLEASIGGFKMLDFARELLEISRHGLSEQRELNRNGQDETIFLRSIEEIIRKGKSPGRIAADLWDGVFSQNPRKLIEHYLF